MLTGNCNRKKVFIINNYFKVAKIAQHACFRVQKEGLPLLNLGHDIHLITNKIPSYADQYKSVSHYHTEDQMYEAIKLHKDVDLFHAHNEPSWFVNAAKGIYPDKPVILDVHDSMLLRYPEDDDDPDHVRISVNERDNMQLADGLIFVSEPMAEMCRETFKLSQPYTVLPSYVPKDLYRLDAYRWVGGIVYEGRVDIPEKNSPDMQFFAYADYREFAKVVSEMGIMFFIFAPNREVEELSEVYQGTAQVQKARPVNELFRILGSHNWGLLGNSNGHEAWKMAMPNKLFDYLASGIPIIALNAPEAGKFVEKHGFGMNITDIKEIPERWGEHRECRANIAKKRFEWCMENHIYKVTALYEEVLDRR